MITARVLCYGELTQEKVFKDTDDDLALEWCEEALADMFADGIECEIMHRGRCVWRSGDDR